ncbi:hypothetical protein Aduo_019778 [Ancylostoma duodenale]
MTVDDAILSKVNKYGKLIKKKEKVAHVLSRLNNIDMTLEILSATNIGRYVNRLCHDSEYGRDASRIIEKWKEIARQSGVRGGDEEPASEDDEPRARHQSPDTAGASNAAYESHSKGYDSGRSRSRHDFGHEDGYSNDDSDGHASGKHRRRHGEDEERYYRECSRKEEHTLKKRRHDGRRDHDQPRYRGERHRDSDSGDESDQHHTKRSRDMEHGREDDDHSSDNAAHSPERTYDSDGYRDVESPKASATSSKQRQSSSHGNTSRKRRHSSEEPEPAQHSSSSKTPAKVIPSKKVVTEFDMILQSADSGQPKHKKRDHHKKWSELPVLSNYQPFPQAVRAAKDAAAPPPDDFNPENMFKPRNERGKVFAGRRKNIAMSVPSLFNICLRVLCNNIGVLLYAEYIPYDVLKPVFEKCTVEELASIESKHPYLEDDSGELWQRFVTKKYPGEEPDCDGSWKDLYYFLEKEKEDKLKRLSQRIGKTHQAESAKGQRKTLLADATAPTYVRRRQMAHGIANASRPLPSAIEVSSARRKIFETGGSKSALAALPSAVVNRNSTVGAKTDRNTKKPPAKKGALMIKTMKMLNMKRK